MKKRLRLNICVSLVVTAALIALGVFAFNSSYLRTFETLCDVISSVKYYFLVLFGSPPSDLPSVTEYSKVITWTAILPSDFVAFNENAEAFFKMLMSKENFLSWLSAVGKKASTLAKVLTVSLPCVMALIIVIKRLYASENTKHNQDTVPLKIFKKVSGKTYQPVKRFVRGYIEFLRTYPKNYVFWLVLCAFHCNLVSIAAEFFAYYLYFAVSFDIAGLYTQAVKLALDLQILFRFFPKWALFIFAWLIFNCWRKKTANNRLRHFEARNCGFINELPIVSMTCGSMGKKKTTMITDMVLSQEVMFRQKALEILRKNDMKFPYFPWICFEKQLQKCMEHHTVYNLATVKAWVKKKRERYVKHGTATGQLYGYNVERYGYTYHDGLKISDLFDVLETYAQAYFIYVIQSSLIVSNYAIRTENELLDSGNFPLWNTDFFTDKSGSDRHSHILDFDVLRLGKKVIENNPYAGSFEFGVVTITEMGKERGNTLELKEVKKGTEETNQKNDLFNGWLKMCRHSATVDNYPFIKVFTDEQRPESWGADARDLSEIITVLSAGEERIALPCYTLEEMLCAWACEKFMRLYEDFRFCRGDNTLLVHLLKTVTAGLYKHNQKMKNRYGYGVLTVGKQRGTLEGKVQKKKYYLANRKIYSRRFSTDCFSDYFNEQAKKTKTGINDYPEYAGEKASVEELKEQNSYFISSLYKNEE